ncbi:hypothetical protein ZIOFF_041203 [Zingiber officinale]|uniref:Uncharacterized protein n=1 Tax=Zingiber officinale TaxID=94328 RepID=A0A8J5KYL2_ZINOF|nr:hypothetical protein ZIOFF_041203 [Zingiber officinale]
MYPLTLVFEEDKPLGGAVGELSSLFPYFTTPARTSLPFPYLHFARHTVQNQLSKHGNGGFRFSITDGLSPKSSLKQ